MTVLAEPVTAFDKKLLAQFEAGEIDEGSYLYFHSSNATQRREDGDRARREATDPADLGLALLASILQASGPDASEKALRSVLGLVGKDDFEKAEDRAIFETLCSASVLDASAFTQRLGMSCVTSRLALALDPQAWHNAAYAPLYARLIARKASVRRLTAEMTSLSIEAQDIRPGVEGDWDQFTVEAERRIMAITRAGSDLNQAVDVGLAADELVGRYADGVHVEGLLTGLASWDEILGGMKPCQMHVIAARPGKGKTALGAQVALNVARQGEKTLFVTCEMAISELVTRLLATISGVYARTIEKQGSRIPDVRKASESLRCLPLKMIDPQNRKVAAIEAEARRIDGLKLVVIDYLQLLEPTNRKMTRYEQVSEISRDVKLMSRSLNCAVIALCQLSREAERDGKPKMHHLRDTGQIEQDAHSITLLHFDDSDKGTVSLSMDVAKNRSGQVSMTQAEFDRPLFRITDDGSGGGPGVEVSRL